MHYSLYIAMRHLRTKRRSGFVSRVTIIAVGGTFVGVATLIIVLSLMNGFEEELRNRIVEFNTHALVFTRTKSAWTKIDSVAVEVEKLPEVIDTSPFVRSESLIYYELIPGVKANIKGVIVKGVDLERERNVSAVIDSFNPEVKSFDVKWFEDQTQVPGIVLGEELAKSLRISIGEKVSLVSAPTQLQAGVMKPSTREFRVISFFKTGVYEFDSRFAYISIKEAKDFFDFEASTRGFGIKLRDIYRADKVDSKIQDLLHSFEYGTNNWINMNRNLFSYIKVEKILMFLLLGLIILVAAFNLVGMLTMVIMEKRAEIGILRSMGASSGGIMSIFMIEGTIIGFIGTFLGVIGGLTATVILKQIQLDLPPDVYFINTLPVVVKGLDIFMISVASLVISIIATVYPSWEACHVLPLDAIQYE
ncbi:MAG: FtsX-like permease family protein [Candidatus Krumholzibacteriota bacterium]|nr:FtsX-like permease family protein [Candidatus Krumholzibacteriota bacterium]